MRSPLNRRRAWWVSFAAAGSTLVLSGCDPNVRDTVLSGVSGAASSLATTFINAFFESLQQQEETPTTVKAIFDAAPSYFA